MKKRGDNAGKHLLGDGESYHASLGHRDLERTECEHMYLI